MAIPKALQEANQRADDLLKARSQPKDTGEQPTQGQQADTGQQAQQNQENQQPKPDQQAKQTDDSSTWEARYRTLFGKYQAEVPRMAEENRELRQKIRDLEARVNSMGERQPAPPANEQQQAQVQGIDFDKLAQEYPDDLVNTMKALAARYDATAQENAALRTELKDLKGNLDTMHAETAQDRQTTFLRQLDKAAPNWRAINAPDTPLGIAWRQWLGTPNYANPGDNWQATLNRAHAALDADGVAEVFKAFEESTKAQSRGNQSQPAPVPDNSPASVSPDGKKIWAKSEIDQFYKDVQTGRMLKRGVSPQQIAQIESEIDTAWRENRVNPRA